MSDPKRPDSWATGRPNLVAAYPAHVPMGLPLPADEPASTPTASPWPAPTLEAS